MSTSDNRPCFIYAIIHTASGRRYIGSTVIINLRWIKHRSLLKNHKHHCAYLQNAWDKYGAAAFDFCILQRLENNEPIARAKAELQAISQYPCYNSRTASLGLTNFINSAETRLKISNGLTKKMEDPAHVEWLRKRGEALSVFNKDPETRKKRSKTTKNSWNNPKRRQSTSEKLRIHWETDGIREAHSIRVKAFRGTPEAREKNSKTAKAL